jgi:hypothetical protein
MIYTLCGSTRFPDAFAVANMHLSAMGHVDEPRGARYLTSDGDETTPGKRGLDELHLRKIDLSDAVFVVNVAGYVGSSTQREIAYARATGKAVVWMFPDAVSDDTLGHAFRFSDRVEWNPTGNTWKSGSVEQVDTRSVVIALDENDQTMRVSPENLRPLRRVL